MLQLTVCRVSGVCRITVGKASELARPGESREDLKSGNQPTSDEQVVRGRGISVEIVSADFDRGRTTLRLPQ